MNSPHSRNQTIQHFRNKLAEGRPIIGAGAGTGISAKCEEAGGVDLIVIYNSGRYRMAGRGSLAGLLPYGNANEIVKEMAREILTAVTHTPVLAGVCATDPFMIRNLFLKELKELGFAGIQNFPTVGLIDGTFRTNLEETGMSYQLEVDCIAAAHDLDLLTTPYVFNTDEARLMTEAGADIIVAHMGLTTNGTVGALTSKSLEDCIDDVQAIVDTCKSIRPDVLVLCHGGPIAAPKDAQYVLEGCRALDGFYGASSMERLPTETAITAEIKKFSSLKMKSGRPGGRPPKPHLLDREL
jgi:predicted TIM-barrel enzyme